MLFDENEKEHHIAFTHMGNRFETNMGHTGCVRCDAVSGKYGRKNQHEFLEFDHLTGKNVPRDLGHKECEHCDIAKKAEEERFTPPKDATLTVNKKGHITQSWKEGNVTMGVTDTPHGKIYSEERDKE